MLLLLILTIPVLAWGTADQKTASIDDKKQQLQNELLTAEQVRRLEILNDLTYLLKRVSPREALAYGEQALALSQQLNDREQAARALSYLGLIHSSLGDNSESLAIHKQALQLREDLADDKGIATSLNNIGSVYWKLGVNEKAVDCYLRSLRILENLNHERGISITTNNIGLIYWTIKDYDKALEYFDRSLRIREGIGDKSLIVGSYNNIGLVFKDLERFQEALESLEKAESILLENDDQARLAPVLNNIGIVKKELNDYQGALQYYRRSLALSQGIEERDLIAETTKNMGDLYRRMGAYDNALKYLTMGLQYAEETGLNSATIESHLYLANLHEELGSFEKALDHHRKHSEMKDAIFDEEKSKQIAEMETRYETEKKERENQLLRSETELQEAKIRRQQTLTAAISAGLLLSLLLAIVMSRANLQRRRTNKALSRRTEELSLTTDELRKANEKKNLLLGVATHELRQPLNVIDGYVGIVLSRLDRAKFMAEDAEMLLTRAKNASISMQRLIEDLLDFSAIESGKVEMRLGPGNVNDVLQECFDVHQRAAEAKEISLNWKPQTLPTIEFDRTRMAEVVHNLISNAIKFTWQGGSVTVSTEVDENQVVTHVQDTGQGMNETDLKTLFTEFSNLTSRPTGDEKSTGLGLAIVRKLVRLHGGEVWVRSSVDKGSTFSFSLPRQRQAADEAGLQST